jgi:hypothetical protein
MHTVKGMVQVMGKTYRIVRAMPKLYEVISILDDALVGSFRCGPVLEVVPSSIDADTLRLIAGAAIREAKTSWAGRLSA